MRPTAKGPKQREQTLAGVLLSGLTTCVRKRTHVGIAYSDMRKVRTAQFLHHENGSIKQAPTPGHAKSVFRPL